MLFLENIMATDEGRRISNLAKDSCTYSVMYNYWLESLFERVMRLFVWENTGEVKPKEIEQRLLLQGHCGIAMLKKELTAFYGSFNGVTKYMDEWTNYMVHCPVYSGNKEIGKDIIVIDNNSMRNSTFPLVHHYATMLAHTEVSLTMALINARESGGTPVVGTEKQKKSVNEYQNKLFNGQYGVVVDTGFLGIEYAGTNKETKQDIMDIMETREKLIKSFYSDIGVRSSFEKRNNTVQAEVEADTSLLLLNLADMLKCRENACKEINSMFGTNWSVHVAEEIDYGAENQRVMFDTNTVTHVAEEETGNENVE